MPQIAIYRLPAVCEVTGLSKATIYRLLARGEFPARVKLSPRCVGWRVAEVDAWLAAREAASERPVPG
jgi:prophage regulatory protein